ncbi:unnamed protein product [Cuscuta campestris]|uniref:Uncharacterized protein n=1 Tax=Cuscuta campestris TaxID=132261 RepID=A0A484LDF9_9ASTE|nr:unnamed protein product [Cuscuta campestris]
MLSNHKMVMRMLVISFQAFFVCPILNREGNEDVPPIILPRFARLKVSSQSSSLIDYSLCYGLLLHSFHIVQQINPDNKKQRSPFMFPLFEENHQLSITCWSMGFPCTIGALKHIERDKVY